MDLETTALLSDENGLSTLFDRELSWLSFNELVLLQAALPHLAVC